MCDVAIPTKNPIIEVAADVKKSQTTGKAQGRFDAGSHDAWYEHT
jgi:hypothetical protein